MSLLRTVLQVRAINKAVRAAGRIILPRPAYAAFDYKLPVVENFAIALPSGQMIHWMPQGDIMSKLLKYGGWDGYETASTRLFYHLSREAQTVFDVGAYLGYFALLGAGAKTGNEAYAFEAVPLLAERCRKLAELNPALQVRVESAAVGNVAGMLPLYLPKDPYESDTSTNPAHRPNRQRVEVPAIRLDDYVRKQGIRRVDLLKIDTETTEPEVLKGMREIIAAWRPVMIVEVLPTADIGQLTEFLRVNDYRCARLEDATVRPMEAPEPDAELRWLNFIFCPVTGKAPVTEAALAVFSSGHIPVNGG